MCGIAGIMFKGVSDGAATGKALIDMLDGCQHRGPDSTGEVITQCKARHRHRFCPLRSHP